MTERPPEGSVPTPDLLAPDHPWSGPAGGPPVEGVGLTPLPGHKDARGWFTKVFQRSEVVASGGDGEVAEVYLSGSARGVVRGLHFQVPPHDHAKTVACIAGAVLDVVVDLRVGSPSEGAATLFRLDAAAPARLHLPPGTAHGFQALTDGATMAYVVSSEHAPDHDRGVHHASVGVRWPVTPVLVSDRDAGFEALSAFTSPFRSEAADSRG